MSDSPTTTTTTTPKGDVWVNNLNKTAIENARDKMKLDEELGGRTPVKVSATWENGLVTGVGGKLVCYPAPELQLASYKMGPSTNSYCPLVAGGCFSLVIMMQAAYHDLKFESFTTNMSTKANYIGCYKKGAVMNNGGGDNNPWSEHGIRLNMTIQGPQTTDELVKLADRADKYCPSSEIMKRDFPVEIDKFEVKTSSGYEDSTDWEDVPVWYDMKKYKELSELQDYYVEQNADMVWHCQNENESFPDSLMTFTFPEDGNSKLVLSHDQPLSSGKYANPVQACFFGGLSSFMHTVATRLYIRGYKVERIEGTIHSILNKRKVFAVESNSYVFPEGASIEIEIWTNAPSNIMNEIQWECEEMSPTFMNWRNELPLEYAIYRKKPSGNKYGSGGPKIVAKQEKNNDDDMMEDGASSAMGSQRTIEFDLKESGVRKGGMPLAKFMKRIFGFGKGSKSSSASRAESSISSKISDTSF